MIRNWIITASVAALSACASSTIAPGDALQGVTQPGQWAAPSQTSANVLSADWLADFHDAQLVALVGEALAHNHDLRASAARLDQADALARVGAAARLPSVDLSARSTRTIIQNAKDTNAHNLSASVSWEADVWGRVADRARAGYADALAAQADYEAARLSVAGRTAQAWFDLIEAGQQMALAADDVQTRERSQQLVERRYARGLSTSLDLRLARSALAGTRASLALRDQQRANAARRLEIILGRYPAEEIDMAATLPTLPTLTGAGTPADLLVRRPDVRAVEARLKAAGFRVGEARKALLPRLTLSPNATTGGTKISDLFDLDTLVGQLVGALAQPVFRGGALRNDVKRAKAAQRERVETYISTVLTAWREAEDALDGEVYLARRVAALEESAREAEEAEKLAEREYGRGVGTIFELLDAQRRRINAQSQLLAAGRERAANRVRLHLAIAGDFNAEIKTNAEQTAALPVDEEKSL